MNPVRVLGLCGLLAAIATFAAGAWPHLLFVSGALMVGANSYALLYRDPSKPYPMCGLSCGLAENPCVRRRGHLGSHRWWR